MLPAHSDPLDEVISADNNYLYVLEGTFGGVVGLSIQPDGGLVEAASVTGTPATSYGMTGYCEVRASHPQACPQPNTLIAVSELW